MPRSRSQSPGWPWSKLTPKEREDREKAGKAREALRISERKLDEEIRLQEAVTKRENYHRERLDKEIKEIKNKIEKLMNKYKSFRGRETPEYLLRHNEEMEKLRADKEYLEVQKRNLYSAWPGTNPETYYLAKPHLRTTRYDEDLNMRRFRPTPVPARTAVVPDTVETSSDDEAPPIYATAEGEDLDPSRSLYPEGYSPSGGVSKKLMSRSMRTAATARRSSKVTAGSPVSATYLRYRDTTTGRFVSMRTRY